MSEGMTNQKAKHYAGLLALLEHKNLTSILLSVSFREAISRGCNISMEEFDEYMNFAYQNLDTDTSDIYVDWK